MNDRKTIGPGQLLVVQGAVIIYSFCGVFQKLAAGCETLSLPFILYYACSIGILFIYAFLWQIILKRIPLTTAYSNRAIAIIWTLIWGVLLFHEGITWTRVVGAVVICCGVFLVTTGGDGESDE